MATHSSTLAWGIPWTEEPGGLQSIESHDYWKNHGLTRRTFVGKVMSLLFNMLSMLVIAFLPRIKYLLISWLQSPSAVILEAKKIKSVTVYIVSPSICHKVMGPDLLSLKQYIRNLIRPSQ